MCASVYFLPRAAAAAGWWWSLPMFYILASVIITYETSGWLVVVVGFQFSLSFTPPCFYTSTTPKTFFFFLLLKSKCMYTHTHIEREKHIRKSLFLLYTILSIHTRLFYFPPSSRVSSSFGSLAPTSFSPLKKTLSADIVCYVLRTCVIGLYTGEKKILSSLSSACIGSPTSQKSTPRTLTHRRRRRRTSFWFYIFSAGVERKEWN